MSATADFLRLWGRLRDLDAATQLLEWDQETMMPAAGVAARAQALATLAGLGHQLETAAELADAVAACAAATAGDALWEAQLREARRRIDEARRVPRELTEALAAACSHGLAAWQDARKARDFGRFAASLAEIVALKRQEAAALAAGGRPYDALLNRFEPGATAAALQPLFGSLTQRLAALVAAVKEAPPVDESAACCDAPEESQRRFVGWVAEQLGFDFGAGRLDLSAHPFCIGIDRRDVRLTWRFDPGDVRPALFGVLHEAGHGLYEQGLPEAWQRSPLGVAASTGLHESQSRLWENQVGRSQPFWRWLLPHLRRAFPGLTGDVEQLWPAMRAVRPSLIRVEADEVTYNLHIAVRFELERALFAGDLEVSDLPGAWNERYRALLGVTPAHDGEGVLQDLHWAAGAFGYFPTYTLGTLAAAQLATAAAAALGDLPEALEAGSFAPLLGWLRREVHAHGRRYPAAELIASATGRPLAADDFLHQVEGVAHALYGTPAPASPPPLL